MEEKKTFFQKIAESRIRQIVFFIASMTVIVGTYAELSKHAENVAFERVVRNTTVTEDYSILSSIDDVIIADGKVQIAGWVLRLDSVNEELALALKEVGDENEIIVRTDFAEMGDVEEYFKPGWEFGEVGFKVDIRVLANMLVLTMLSIFKP